MSNVVKLQRISNVACRVMGAYPMLCSFNIDGTGLNESVLCNGDGKMLHTSLMEWRKKNGWGKGNMVSILDFQHPDMRSWEDLPQRRQELYRLVAALMSMGDL